MAAPDGRRRRLSKDERQLRAGAGETRMHGCGLFQDFAPGTPPSWQQPERVGDARKNGLAGRRRAQRRCPVVDRQSGPRTEQPLAVADQAFDRLRAWRPCGQ